MTTKVFMWWRGSYFTTDFNEVQVSKIERFCLTWIDQTTARKSPIDSGYTFFCRTLKEAIELKTKRLERSVHLMETAGDDPSFYKKQLKEMGEKYD